MPKFKWQKSFHDHIIRKEKSLNKIRQYIRDNPINWNSDIENQYKIENIESELIQV